MHEIKGALHIHSNLSYDGKFGIEKIKSMYKNKGYSFICLTEHAKHGWDDKKQKKLVQESKRLSDEDFIIIPGLEFITDEGVEILGICVTDFIKEKNAEKLIKEIRNKKGMSIIAHPKRKDMKSIKKIINEVDFVEIWNPTYDSFFYPRIWKLKLLNKNAKGICGDDFHQKYKSIPIKLKAKWISKEEILSLLKQGKFSIGNNDLIQNYKNINFYIKSHIFNFFRDLRKTISKATDKINIKV
jgi:hypothetical protein